MSLRQLPIELLDAICQQALPADLVSLSSTASSILPVAQRLLYRHISVSQHLGVVATLAKKPELAHHVRTFALTLLDCSTVFDAFYRLLAVALFSMTELTSLDLFVDSGASWILTATPHLTFPRLVHFSCSFPLDSHLASFLSTTEALLELEISGSEILPIPVLPDASIPRLSHFIGSSHAANAVVPGRPVESIHLQSGDLTESDAVTLAKSSAQIIILSATTSSLPVSLLETLTQCMPRLAYLRMMTTYNFPQAPDVVSYLSIPQQSYAHLPRHSMNRQQRL